MAEEQDPPDCASGLASVAGGGGSRGSGGIGKGNVDRSKAGS
jgi:hypothetical protein